MRFYRKWILLLIFGCWINILRVPSNKLRISLKMFAAGNPIQHLWMFEVWSFRWRFEEALKSSCLLLKIEEKKSCSANARRCAKSFYWRVKIVEILENEKIFAFSIISFNKAIRQSNSNWFDYELNVSMSLSGFSCEKLKKGETCRVCWISCVDLCFGGLAAASLG